MSDEISTEACNCYCGVKPEIEQNDDLYTVCCPICHSSISTTKLSSSIELWNDLHSGEYNAKS